MMPPMPVNETSDGAYKARHGIPLEQHTPHVRLTAEIKRLRPCRAPYIGHIRASSPGYFVAIDKVPKPTVVTDKILALKRDILNATFKTIDHYYFYCSHFALLIS
jgi:hypothetical protein